LTGEHLAPARPESGAERYRAAIAAIDAANADDPATIVVDGVERPKELAHSEMMSDWVRRLDPDADELQLLAARAHHLRRWSIPRASYPEGRAGYLRWRTTLNRQHAAEVASILESCGYTGAEIERVQAIIRKEHLRTDAVVQTHEDALCLVFLQTQLAGVADQLGDDHTVEILRKSIAKMSPRGRDEAIRLELPANQRALLERAASS
jgi:hypothetical protein